MRGNITSSNHLQMIFISGFLKFKRLKYVMIDWRFEDAKKRTLVDIPEVIMPRCVDVFLEAVRTSSLCISLMLNPILMVWFCYSLNFRISKGMNAFYVC